MTLTRAEKIEKIALLQEKERREEWHRVIPKLQFLYEPMRYKVARGGRGSGKSWEFARAIIKRGSQENIRVLCTREVQKSIKDSVHKLLSDQIAKLGLESHYEVLATEIRGKKNNTLIIFSGLSDQTAESIKSYEGVDICWCEEGQAITKRSWDILIPTIRKADSEIWVSFNPELDSDETYVRFVACPPDDCISELVNYNDNPWFPEVLERERQRCKVYDPDGYDNIWEGKCKPAVVGAIYYHEVATAESEGRVTVVPYDPMLKVHVVMDLGWNDSMSVILCQRIRSEIRIIEYIEDDHKTLDWVSGQLRLRLYNWGKLYLPHDGAHRDYKTGKSAGEIMEALGWSVEFTPNMSVEDGIRATRMAFRQMFFDQGKTERLMQCVKRYRRTIVHATQTPGAPLHDEHSHGADCLRYVAINVDNMTNSDTASTSKIRRPGGMAV